MNEPTAALWEQLKSSRELFGMTLVGDAALSLRLGHRTSQNLEFNFSEFHLPSDKIHSLLSRLAPKGWEFRTIVSTATMVGYENLGMKLSNYSQNYKAIGQAGAVELTFSTGSAETRRLFDAGPWFQRLRPRVASLAELFRLKCLSMVDRANYPDQFDLYVLMKQGHFGANDLINAFERAQASSKLEAALTRFCEGVPGLNNEGLEPLMDSPPTIAEVQEYFGALLQLSNCRRESSRNTNQSVLCSSR
ncbi:MAG: hypothetical protein EPN64_06175 [Burkholderiaceae bacterium]|nr:MAG: hypothetical protein EPN64_06175 [Burkholderiaceae bacterium]